MKDWSEWAQPTTADTSSQALGGASQPQSPSRPPLLGICHECLSLYPYRKGKTRCSNKCRVYASRPKQNSQESPTKKRKNLEFFDVALRLAERLYSLPPDL